MWLFPILSSMKRMCSPSLRPTPWLLCGASIFALSALRKCLVFRELEVTNLPLIKFAECLLDEMSPVASTSLVVSHSVSPAVISFAAVSDAKLFIGLRCISLGHLCHSLSAYCLTSVSSVVLITSFCYYF